MKLNRANFEAQTSRSNQAAPQRIVHIGLGAFHRAHQAWFTSQVDTDKAWGITAFTGRSDKAAKELAPQDGLFTLVTRGEDGDHFEVIDSIILAVDGNDTQAFIDAIVDEQTAIVTLTITEGGYGMDAAGHVDKVNSPAALRRLATALNERRHQNGKPIAIVSCDNMPSNGALLKVAMGDLFEAFGAEAQAWLGSEVSFVTTSIDRITPKTTEEDIAIVKAETGWDDASPVITEPFKDWVLEGEFPLGRPAWQNAGAKFVDNIEPFENRKLWLLNGSHSLLAYAAQLRGHETVAEAINDEVCLGWVQGYWAEAVQHLPAAELDLDNYREALLARYRNSRIAHRLAQIAIDGSTKLRVRIVPTAKAELAAGRDAKGCAVAIGAWVEFVLAKQGVVEDSQAEAILSLVTNASNDLSNQLVALIDPQLSQHQNFMDLVLNRVKV
jgi:fructuronate reductase